jgi:hypothetical protein
MRGEELEGLSAEELHQMERKLEAGLYRVLSTKVGSDCSGVFDFSFLDELPSFHINYLIFVSSGPAIHATNQRITTKGESGYKKTHVFPEAFGRKYIALYWEQNLTLNKVNL